MKKTPCSFLPSSLLQLVMLPEVSELADADDKLEQNEENLDELP
jgi:hypothetical protein